MQNKSLTIILTVIILAIVGFIFFSKKETQNNNKEEAIIGSWQETELTDVLTGEKFKVSDFKGKPILLESFAVWCPTCLRQQKEIKKLQDETGEEIIHISLDIDLNEDAEKIINHARENNLDWLFAIAPIELSRSLIDEFGQTVINAPAAPVILICADQNTRFLKRGVKSAPELKEEVNKGC